MYDELDERLQNASTTFIQQIDEHKTAVLSVFDNIGDEINELKQSVMKKYDNKRDAYTSPVVEKLYDNYKRTFKDEVSPTVLLDEVKEGNPIII